MSTAFHDELARRMARPQRHRLLQGYPMLPLHREAVPDTGGVRRLDGELRSWSPAPVKSFVPEDPWIRFDASRPLILGVLPHAQCNPRVAGCGFCTFPHDRYDKPALLQSVERTGDEAAWLVREYPGLAKRRVDAVYFGGATANLAPHRALAALGAELAKSFDLAGAELTLEGVPSLFRSLLAGPFEAFAAIPARHRRISMGVQTFDPAWIARMGRQAFGDLRTVSAVVDKAHRHGMTTSGDFLFDLPAQPREAMIGDLRAAEACGLDQVCVYHLVLTEETGAAWASDASMMAARPTLSASRDNWLAVRDWLLEHGFVQTTLTNFERASVHASDRRFVYEPHSFTPERYDALGLGPASISTFVDTGGLRAVKLVRGKGGRHLHDDLYFPYDEPDVRLLHVTRTLARLAIDRGTYRARFGEDLVAHFGEAVEAVVEAGLATLDDDALRLTPGGMFFADSVAGLFAWPRVEALRATAAGRHTRDELKKRVGFEFMG